MSAATDQTREATTERATERLDRERLHRVEEMATATAPRISQNLLSLDKEWDIERRLEANAAALGLISAVLVATHSRRWLVLSGAVSGFLLQHAIQGWCPPVEIFRRFGARTRNEIDAERTAVKALRGDFDGVSGTVDPPAAARQALDAAGSR